MRMGQAKVDHTGEYKLVADNGHGKDEVSTCHQKQWVSAAWTRKTNSFFYWFPCIYNLSFFSFLISFFSGELHHRRGSASRPARPARGNHVLNLLSLVIIIITHNHHHSQLIMVDSIFCNSRCWM